MGRCLAPWRWDQRPICCTIRHGRGGRKKERCRRVSLTAPTEPRTGSASPEKGHALKPARAVEGAILRLFEHLQQLAVDIRVTRQDAAGLEHVVAPVQVGREAAGLAYQRDPGRHVPGRQVAPNRRRDARPRPRRGRARPLRNDACPRPCPAPRHARCAPAPRRRGWDARRPRPRRRALAPGHPQPLIVEERAPLPCSAVKSSSLTGL